MSIDIHNFSLFTPIFIKETVTPKNTTVDRNSIILHNINISTIFPHKKVEFHIFVRFTSLRSGPKSNEHENIAQINSVYDYSSHRKGSTHHSLLQKEDRITLFAVIVQQTKQRCPLLMTFGQV